MPWNTIVSQEQQGQNSRDKSTYDKVPSVGHDLICVTPAEDLSDSEEVFPKEIAKWNSNDLMDKIEAADTEETSGMITTEHLSRGRITQY